MMLKKKFYTYIIIYIYIGEENKILGVFDIMV